MSEQKTLTELNSKHDFYKKLEVKLSKIMNGEMTIEDYHTEVCNKIEKLKTDIKQVEDNIEFWKPI